jgi:hypothetical protein
MKRLITHMRESEKRKQTMYEDKDKVGVPMTNNRTKEQDNNKDI